VAVSRGRMFLLFSRLIVVDSVRFIVFMVLSIVDLLIFSLLWNALMVCANVGIDCLVSCCLDWVSDISCEWLLLGLCCCWR